MTTTTTDTTNRDSAAVENEESLQPNAQSLLHAKTGDTYKHYKNLNPTTTSLYNKNGVDKHKNHAINIQIMMAYLQVINGMKKRMRQSICELKLGAVDMYMIYKGEHSVVES